MLRRNGQLIWSWSISFGLLEDKVRCALLERQIFSSDVGIDYDASMHHHSCKDWFRQFRSSPRERRSNSTQAGGRLWLIHLAFTFLAHGYTTLRRIRSFQPFGACACVAASSCPQTLNKDSPKVEVAARRFTLLQSSVPDAMKSA